MGIDDMMIVLTIDDIIALIRTAGDDRLPCKLQICKIGVVSDYYNLIRRHNINNYFLCKVKYFGEKHLTSDEQYSFHLSTRKLTYDEALCEYEKSKTTKIARLVCNREVPILKRAREIIDKL